MKKALVFLSNDDFMGLDEAITRDKEGYEIHFMICDGSIRGCNVCRACDKATCILCTYTMKKLTRRLMRQYVPYHLVTISDYITGDIIREAENAEFEYSDVDSLKNITFHGVEIGYGAFSTFVTWSRNVMPTFNDSLKEYINKLMRNEIKETLALERYIDEIKPELIVFHNGRFSNLKPIYCIAKSRGIDYLVTEKYTMPDGEVRKDNFINDIPHSFEAITKKIEFAWENVGEEGVSIGKAFFENRRNARPAGDKVYTADQVLGKLPDGFNPSKRNISIFNSSEDEFFAISKEYDRAVLFPNQYSALKTIFEHYKDNNNIHFYLRIHPNLKDVPWKSHTLLYELKYSNVTIIPPTSPISSYTLMDASEKVIVFNSTMGLESSYWGKSVIALSRCTYTFLDIVYTPSSKEEVFTLIDNKELPSLQNKENCYKVACYYMGYSSEAYNNFKVIKYKVKHDISVHPLLKFMGSAKLYAYLERILYKLSTRIGDGRKFRKLAERTA